MQGLGVGAKFECVVSARKALLQSSIRALRATRASTAKDLCHAEKTISEAEVHAGYNRWYLPRPD